MNTVAIVDEPCSASVHPALYMSPSVTVVGLPSRSTLPTPTMELITSKDNQKLKLIRSLHLKKRRQETGLFLAEGGKMARKWFKKLREKPERFEDMPDDRYRLRFAYKALLKSGRVAGWIPSATPREVGGKLQTQALKDMTEAYCAARYDLERDVTPEQAAAAKAAMQALQKRGSRG